MASLQPDKLSAQLRWIEETGKRYQDAKRRGVDGFDQQQFDQLRAVLALLSLLPTNEQTEKSSIPSFGQFALQQSDQAKGCHMDVISSASDSSSDQEIKASVFLGGSCNPTTWRRDTAIPFLENAGITYYNPQVDEWSPDLIEIEAQAKENAAVLFFVLDNATRGLASMVEVAYNAAIGRPLVVVMQPFKEGMRFGDDEVDPRQLDDLNRGREILTLLLRDEAVPIFEDMDAALAYCAALLRGKKTIVSRPTDVTTSTTQSRLLNRLHTVLSMLQPQVLEHDVVFSTAMLQKIVGLLLGEEVACSDLEALLQAIDQAQPLGDNPTGLDTLLAVCACLSSTQHSVADSRFASWLQSVGAMTDGGDSASLDLVKKDIFLGGSCGDAPWRSAVCSQLRVLMLRSKP
eukprot:m.230520 g.230520  ORF g.230520 m.230520 type:complete len:403 (+) comp17060_c3_seq9:349-1557(+)